MDNPNEGGKERESDGVWDESLGRWETIGSEVVGMICEQQRGSVLRYVNNLKRNHDQLGNINVMKHIWSESEERTSLKKC